MIDLPHRMLAVSSASILVVGALFPIVNPLGSAAIFQNMVGDITVEVQRLLTRRIAIYCFVLLMASMLWGVKILSFFGIDIYAVQIAGGLVVTAAGWTLLSKPVQKTKSAAGGDDDVLANAFYPYTLPLTVGPGSISVAVTLGAHLPEELHARSIYSPEVLIAALVGASIICLIVYICFLYARAAERLLGASGTEVFMRLMSFILLCIGIQILCAGLEAYAAASLPRLR
jgi:multiple antibiotic resistance protein